MERNEAKFVTVASDFVTVASDFVTVASDFVASAVLSHVKLTCSPQVRGWRMESPEAGVEMKEIDAKWNAMKQNGADMKQNEAK